MSNYKSSMNWMYQAHLINSKGRELCLKRIHFCRTGGVSCWPKVVPVHIQVGCPGEFKHPSNEWYGMIKEEFGMTDDDFQKRRKKEGHGKVLTCRWNRRVIRHLAFQISSGRRTSQPMITAGFGTATARPWRRPDFRADMVRQVPDMVVHPEKQEGRAKDRRVLQSREDPGLCVRRRLVRDVRPSDAQRRRDAGDEHPHEQAAVDQ